MSLVGSIGRVPGKTPHREKRPFKRDVRQGCAATELEAHQPLGCGLTGERCTDFPDTAAYDTDTCADANSHRVGSPRKVSNARLIHAIPARPSRPLTSPGIPGGL